MQNRAKSLSHKSTPHDYLLSLSKYVYLNMCICGTPFKTHLATKISSIYSVLCLLQLAGDNRPRFEHVFMSSHMMHLGMGGGARSGDNTTNVSCYATWSSLALDATLSGGVGGRGGDNTIHASCSVKVIFISSLASEALRGKSHFGGQGCLNLWYNALSLKKWRFWCYEYFETCLIAIFVGGRRGLWINGLTYRPVFPPHVYFKVWKITSQNKLLQKDQDQNKLWWYPQQQ